jgi:hypothetical protein
MIAQLIGALEDERHFRRPLLHNLIDELSACLPSRRHEAATDHALDLLYGLERGHLDAEQFRYGVGNLRQVLDSHDESAEPERLAG